MESVTFSTDTSVCAVSSAKPSRSQQMVLDVLIAAHRNRLGPLTAGEIRETLERLHSPRRFDKGWVTGRLDELRERGAVEQSEDVKFNPLTKRTSHLWYVPLTQARLCA